MNLKEGERQINVLYSSQSAVSWEKIAWASSLTKGACSPGAGTIYWNCSVSTMAVYHDNCHDPCNSEASNKLQKIVFVISQTKNQLPFWASIWNLCSNDWIDFMWCTEITPVKKWMNIFPLKPYLHQNQIFARLHIWNLDKKLFYACDNCFEVCCLPHYCRGWANYT